MSLKIELKLSEGQNEVKVDVDSVEIRPQGIKVNGSETIAIEPDESYWHVCDGAQLGDERLTGGEYGVILGQAKLAE